MPTHLGEGLRLDLLELLQAAVLGEARVEEGHGGHLVALSPHLAEGHDDLRPCEQGHEGEVRLLFQERVLGYTHQSYRDGGDKGQCQTSLGWARDQGQSPR